MTDDDPRRVPCPCGCGLTVSAAVLIDAARYDTTDLDAVEAMMYDTFKGTP